VAITKRLRKRRKATQRLDLTSLREALKDRRCWASIATTVIPGGEDSHWSLELNDAGDVVDVLVDVVTHPDGQELTCRLDIRGSIEIPALGDEVLVCLPSGRIDFMPTITGFMSSGSVPNPDGQGPALERVVIAKAEGFIHDGGGGAKELAYKDDVQQVRDDLHLHEHDYASPGGPAITTGGPTVTAPTGTTVLKAK
jgi:hypothetical protein